MPVSRTVWDIQHWIMVWPWNLS